MLARVHLHAIAFISRRHGDAGRADSVSTLYAKSWCSPVYSAGHAAAGVTAKTVAVSGPPYRYPGCFQGLAAAHGKDAVHSSWNCGLTVFPWVWRHSRWRPCTLHWVHPLVGSAVRLCAYGGRRMPPRGQGAPLHRGLTATNHGRPGARFPMFRCRVKCCQNFKCFTLL